MADTSDYRVVAAIDFGTTYSGYAFTFTSPGAGDKDQLQAIITNKNWVSNHESYKTPTSVLTDSDGKFLAFGYDAEDKYCQAVEEGNQDAMLLFRKFKMILHTRKTFNLTVPICSVNATLKPAIVIFVHALQYLREHLLTALERSGNMPNPEKIRWVITVPAIWSDSAKQFMREAAFRAKYINEKNSEQLVIALEPEAASLCCRRLKTAQYEDCMGVNFSVGTKYLILDCGGGTADMTAHIVDHGHKVKELITPSGGPWGGAVVDARFVEFMESVLGKEFISAFREQCPHASFQFLSSFEKLKKSFNPSQSSRIAIPMSYAMASKYAEMYPGKNIEAVLKSAQGMSFVNGSIVLPFETAQEFFNPVTEAILKHVEVLLSHEKLQDLTYILMVGGFSECEYLQLSVKRMFERNNIKVLIPSDAQLAVLKGAVLFGQEPDEIEERILRKTFGFEVERLFDPKIHDKSRKFFDAEGVPRCRNVFSPVIAMGTSIAFGGEFTYSLKKTFIGKERCNIYTLDAPSSEQTQYIDDPGMEYGGTLTVDGLKGSDLEILFKFGKTEIEVEVLVLQTGQRVKADIDILS